MAKEINFIDPLRKLRADPNALNWQKRLELVQAVARALQSESPPVAALLLCSLLAYDSKWEVRKEIANLLLFLPNDLQIPLIANLSSDSNGFVRAAVKRAIDVRRQTHRAQRKEKYGLDQVQEELQSLEQKHGSDAVASARRIVDRLNEVVGRKIAHELLGRMTPLKLDVARLLDCSQTHRLERDDLETTLGDMNERLDFIERFLHAMKRFSTALPEARSKECLTDVIADAHAQAIAKLKAGPVPVQTIAFRVAISGKLTVSIARLETVVALSDLMKNAYEAFDRKNMPQKPELLVQAKLSRSADYVELEIRDNGIGMSAADLADVRQYIAGRSSKKSEGTGFGVPNARRMILAQGGTFDIASTLEKGTTITLTLPCKKE